MGCCLSSETIGHRDAGQTRELRDPGTQDVSTPAQSGGGLVSTTGPDFCVSLLCCGHN